MLFSIYFQTFVICEFRSVGGKPWAKLRYFGSSATELSRWPFSYAWIFFWMILWNLPLVPSWLLTRPDSFSSMNAGKDWRCPSSRVVFPWFICIMSRWCLIWFKSSWLLKLSCNLLLWSTEVDKRMFFIFYYYSWRSFSAVTTLG